MEEISAKKSRIRRMSESHSPQPDDLKISIPPFPHGILGYDANQNRTQLNKVGLDVEAANARAELDLRPRNAPPDYRHPNQASSYPVIQTRSDIPAAGAYGQNSAPVLPPVAFYSNQPPVGPARSFQPKVRFQMIDEEAEHRDTNNNE